MTREKAATPRRFRETTIFPVQHLRKIETALHSIDVRKLGFFANYVPIQSDHPPLSVLHATNERALSPAPFKPNLN